jgi:transcriptional regulator with XRE-family HTH domain
MKMLATMAENSMLTELGRRAQQQRVGMNLTQSQLAQASGVSARTIERFEAGTSIQLDKLIALLRALRLADNLDQLIPDAEVRPLELIGARKGPRQRAYTRKTPENAKGAGWVWGDGR